MRKIDDARDAEDQRKAGPHEEQRRSRRQTGEELKQQGREAHGCKRSGEKKKGQSAARDFLTSAALGWNLAPSKYV
jgi:hypothetical protein